MAPTPARSVFIPSSLLERSDYPESALTARWSTVGDAEGMPPAGARVRRASPTLEACVDRSCPLDKYLARRGTVSASESDDLQRTVFGGSVLPALESTAEAPGHYLVVMEGAEPGRYIEVADTPVTIGRDAKQTFVVGGDTQISRLHARVSHVNGNVLAEDMGSTNGTFVNAQRITTPTVLKEGHLLTVGQQVLRYERRSRREV